MASCRPSMYKLRDRLPRLIRGGYIEAFGTLDLGVLLMHQHGARRGTRTMNRLNEWPLG